MRYAMDVLQTVFPVIFVILIGVLLRKKGLISRERIKALKTAAVNIALPAVLLNAFATTSYQAKTVSSSKRDLLSAAGIFDIGGGIAG